MKVAFQREGAAIVLLGGFGETDATRFGSSEYAKVILGQLWGRPPLLDMDYEKRVHEAMREIVAAGFAESAHDLSDGGLAIALAECCTRSIGAKVTAPAGLFSLFGESPSRILLTTSNPENVFSIAARFHVECPVTGVTLKERLQIGNEDQMLIDIATTDLKRVFEDSLPRLLQTSHAG